jgi:hypothetical protein
LRPVNINGPSSITSADRSVDHESPGRHAFAKHRHRTKAMLLRLEADRAGVGQVVRSAGLLHENMLGAGHCGVDQTIHVS